MNSTRAYLLNCSIDRLAKGLVKHITMWPPVEDIESEELFMFARNLVDRYIETFGSNKVTEIAQSSGSTEEMLKKIEDEIEACEEDGECIVFAKRLSQ